MDSATPHPHSPNSYAKTLLQNPSNHVNQKKAMKKFEDFVFKLAETHPNAPLTPPAKTLLQDRLDQFVSQYKTPDHPPYSAMIERALRELNEKWGSSEKSISQYLEERYDNLPWAHSVLLKHHLEKLCESGEIVETRDKRYGLSGCLNSSTAVKRKPAKRKWKWRYDWERERNSRRKRKLSKKRRQQKCEKDEVIEREQQLTENGAHSEDKSDQTKRLVSCVDGENGACTDPTFLPTEPPGMNSEEARSQQLEIGPSEIVKADISAAYTQEQQEREQSICSQPELSSPERPPGFETICRLGSIELELASAEEFIGSKRTWRQMKRWSGGFPKPRAVTVSSPKAGEYHSLQPQHNAETPQDQQKALDSTVITLKQMHHEEQQSELLKADVVEVAGSVMNGAKLVRDEKYGRTSKSESKKSETIGIHASKNSDWPTELQNEHPFEPYTTMDSPNLSLNLNQADSALPNEQESQELFQQPQSREEKIFQGKQLRRSPRARPGKPELAKDANFLGPRPCPDECPETVYKHQGTLLKQRSGNQPAPGPTEAACTNELQHPRKCQRLQMLLKPKPDAADVENLRVMDDHKGQNSKQSGKSADCTSIHKKMKLLRAEEVLILSNSKQKLQEVQPTKRRPGRPPKHHSARPRKNKLNSSTRLTLDESKCSCPGKRPMRQR